MEMIDEIEATASVETDTMAESDAEEGDNVTKCVELATIERIEYQEPVTTKSADANVVSESEGAEKGSVLDEKQDCMTPSRHHCATPTSEDDGSEFDTVTDSSSCISYSGSDSDDEHDSTSSSELDDVDELHHETATEDDHDTATAAAARELEDLQASALSAENRELSRRLRHVQPKTLKCIDSLEYNLMRAESLTQRAKLESNANPRFRF